MIDEDITNVDPFESLNQRGARFVLCINKRPAEDAWLTKTPPTSREIWDHLRDVPHSRLGIVPASIGCLVFDEDNGRAEIVIREFGEPRLSYESVSKRGRHFWYECKRAGEYGKGKWRHGDAGGDLIASSGMVIVPNPETTCGELDYAIEVAELPENKLSPQGTVTLERALSVASNRADITIEDRWSEGNRNDTLNTEAYKLGRSGRGGQAVERLAKRAREVGLNEIEIRTTIRSGYDAGVKWRETRIIVGAPHMYSVEAEALRRMGYEVRWNLRSARVELRSDGNVHAEIPWCSAEDRLVSRLRRGIGDTLWITEGNRDNAKYKPLIYGKSQFDEILMSHAAKLEVDPFETYLNGLPEWDKIKRLEIWLTELFGVEDTLLTRWAARSIFEAAVARTLDPGCKYDHVIILSGAQGLGKSSAIRHILPKRDYFSDSIDLSAKNKECVENAGNAVICELSDLQGSTRTDLERLKAFITRQADTFRGAYMRYTEDKPRRWIMVGTTNSKTPLPSDAENRRFVVVEIGDPGFAVEPWLAGRREQLWAEAVVNIKNGSPIAMPRDLIPEQRERNEDFTRSTFADDCWETMLLIVGGEFGNMSRWDGLTATEIKLDNERLDGFTTRSIAEALALHGWGRRRKKGRKILVAPIIEDTEQLQQEL